MLIFRLTEFFKKQKIQYALGITPLVVSILYTGVFLWYMTEAYCAIAKNDKLIASAFNVVQVESVAERDNGYDILITPTQSAETEVECEEVFLTVYKVNDYLVKYDITGTDGFYVYDSPLVEDISALNPDDKIMEISINKDNKYNIKFSDEKELTVDKLAGMSSEKVDDNIYSVKIDNTRVIRGIAKEYGIATSLPTDDYYYDETSKVLVRNIPSNFRINFLSQYGYIEMILYMIIVTIVMYFARRSPVLTELHNKVYARLSLAGLMLLLLFLGIFLILF